MSCALVYRRYERFPRAQWRLSVNLRGKLTELERNILRGIHQSESGDGTCFLAEPNEPPRLPAGVTGSIPTSSTTKSYSMSCVLPGLSGADFQKVRIGSLRSRQRPRLTTSKAPGTPPPLQSISPTQSYPRRNEYSRRLSPPRYVLVLTDVTNLSIEMLPGLRRGAVGDEPRKDRDEHTPHL